MQSGLDDEEVAARRETGAHFGQERRLIRRLVQHPECQGEVCRLIHSKAVLPRPVQPDAICHSRPLGAVAHAGEHLRLQVNANDLPFGADQPRQRDRKAAHAAAEVKSGLARPRQPGEDTVGILDQPEQQVVRW